MRYCQVYKKGMEDGFMSEDNMPTNIKDFNLICFKRKDVSLVLFDETLVYPYINTDKGKQFIQKDKCIVIDENNKKTICEENCKCKS